MSSLSYQSARMRKFSCRSKRAFAKSTFYANSQILTDQGASVVVVVGVGSIRFLLETRGEIVAWFCDCLRGVRMGSAFVDLASGQVLIQLSDDWVPPRGWDTAILAELGDLDRPAVLAVSDGTRRDDLLCMAIMTRARWAQQGRIMFHPDFFSVFSDDWFSNKAWQDGVVIDARDRITFEHIHPAFGKGEWDETY
jgi:hypothetical protein